MQNYSLPLPRQEKFDSRRLSKESESTTLKMGGNIVGRRGDNMKNNYTAIIKQDGDWWVGWIAEIPGVNCQERTHKTLLESLKVTLSEAIAFNRQDAISAASSNYEEELVSL